MLMLAQLFFDRWFYLQHNQGKTNEMFGLSITRKMHQTTTWPRRRAAIWYWQTYVVWRNEGFLPKTSKYRESNIYMVPKKKIKSSCPTAIPDFVLVIFTTPTTIMYLIYMYNPITRAFMRTPKNSSRILQWSVF